MKIAYNFIFLLIIILTLSCSKKEEKVTILKEKNLETQMIEVYNQALKEFEIKYENQFIGTQKNKINVF